MSTGKQGLMWLSFYVVLMFLADNVHPVLGVAGIAASSLLGGMMAMFCAVAIVGIVFYGIWLGLKTLWEAIK